LRIAYLVHDYHRNGGHARYVAELATRFQREHDVHVFSDTFEEASGHCIRHHRVPTIRANALATILTYCLPATWMVRRHGPFDIVHAQGFCGLSQNVMTVHMSQHGWFKAADENGVRQTWKKKAFRYLVGALENRAFRPKSARAFIAVSEKLKSDLFHFHGLNETVEVIHHGIDTVTFHPDQVTRHRDRVRLESGIAQQSIVALYVGDWQKAGATLLDTLCRTPDLELMVCTKSTRAPIMAEAAKLGLNNRFHLLPASRDIHAIFAAADFFLFPSFYDTFGMVVAEAMATGLPVVVPRTVGACEWIDPDVNGLIVDSPADLESWARAAQKLAADPALRAKLGTAARSTCLGHSWDDVAARTLEVYRRVSFDTAR
jgi:glycosyltransferase involved in cell wall biosynthesis